MIHISFPWGVAKTSFPEFPNSYTDLGKDKILMGDGIQYEDVRFILNGNDLMVRVKGISDQMTLQGFATR